MLVCVCIYVCILTIFFSATTGVSAKQMKENFEKSKVAVPRIFYFFFFILLITYLCDLYLSIFVVENLTGKSTYLQKLLFRFLFPLYAQYTRHIEAYLLHFITKFLPLRP